MLSEIDLKDWDEQPSKPLYDVLAHNQWAELERDALKAFKVEQYEQLTIDHDNNSRLEALYGLSKPSFNIR